MKIAVLITVFNRVDKTLTCLESLFNAPLPITSGSWSFKVFLTDDGSTDDTQQLIRQKYNRAQVEVLCTAGNLYWAGGMNHSWRAAMEQGGFDGYLWLNNDTIVYSNLWSEIQAAENYSRDKFYCGGIYIGSTRDVKTKKFTYGGFLFKDRWTLREEFKFPNGEFQHCQAGHGNITYVSQDVVRKEGILCDDYLHGVADHDYTYRAFKHENPVFVLRDFVGECENDHPRCDIPLMQRSIKDRLAFAKSPLGYNLRNTLLFQKRCFPMRYPLVWSLSYFKLLFPNFYYRCYRLFRS